MIGVIGLGFVGLTTALGFASYGHTVYVFDSDDERMKHLMSGLVPFHEPHLKDQLLKQTGSGHMFFCGLNRLVKESKIIFICVGTPCDENGRAELNDLNRAIVDILFHIRQNGNAYKVLAIKSTVPPGTAMNKVRAWIETQGLHVGRDIGLVSNPEFLRESYAWIDFVKPEKVVIGEFDTASGSAVANVYRMFRTTDNRPVNIFRTTLNTSEFIKYLSNSFLATLISFSNEMAMLADRIGDIEVGRAFKALHEDGRFRGEPAGICSYIYPGCSYGGYCLPKDTMALYMHAKTDYRLELEVLNGVITTNEKVRDFITDKIESVSTKKSRIGILGLTFKPDSDDVRESPSYYIITRLIQRGYADILAYDPMGMEQFRRTYPEIQIDFASSLDSIVEESEIVVILTAWSEFETVKGKGKTVIDGRYWLNGDVIVREAAAS